MAVGKKNEKEPPGVSETTGADSNPEDSFLLLVAEDDADDYLFIKEAFEKIRGKHEIIWVKDGEALMHRLSSKNGDRVMPNLIILDLNMPKISGFEALHEIKSSSRLRRIPTVIFTTSRSDEDVVRGYDLGVNSFIQKPTNFEDLVNIVDTLHRYWFEVAKLPTPS